MRSRRRALSEHQRLDNASRFADYFSKTAFFRYAKRVSFYIAHDGELDLAPLLGIAWSMKKACFLPVLNGPYSNSLKFVRYRPGDPMGKNKYAIDEPIAAARHRKDAIQLDLVLTPLVAFDDHCNRIGMGGGYYDRTFAFLKNRRHWLRPRMVGVAYEFQQTKSIKAKPWDIPLTAIATNQRMINRL